MSLIILEGVQSSGKSLFGKSFVAAHDNAVFLEEWVDEKVLKEYLSDMKGKARDFQFYIQEETVNRVKKAIELVKEGKVVVLDRGLIGNECFISVQHDANLISDEDMEKYLKSYSYDLIPGFHDVKSTTIYLRAMPEFCLERIRMRAREGEETYTLDYLNQLAGTHDYSLPHAKVCQINKNYTLNGEGLLSISSLLEILTS
jgi:deoxyadenosine/deoxycytidine kinase